MSQVTVFKYQLSNTVAMVINRCQDTEAADQPQCLRTVLGDQFSPGKQWGVYVGHGNRGEAENPVGKFCTPFVENSGEQLLSTLFFWFLVVGQRLVGFGNLLSVGDMYGVHCNCGFCRLYVWWVMCAVVCLPFCPSCCFLSTFLSTYSFSSISSFLFCFPPVFVSVIFCHSLRQLSVL